MTTLTIDIGNTTTDCHVYQDGEWKYAASFQNDKKTEEELRKEFETTILKHYRLDAYIISSVAKTPKILHELLAKIKCVKFDHQTPLPITNRYQTPETLGLDRIALAVAAAKLAPKKNALVISAGTCITYEYITSKSEYLGGAISPGLRMRARAMHEFTERLPLVDFPIPSKINFNNVDYCGIDSTSAIQSGIIKGVVDEIDAKIKHFKEKHPHGKVFLTGGDRIYLENSIKNRTFAVPKMVLNGLNEILQHNIK